MTLESDKIDNILVSSADLEGNATARALADSTAEVATWNVGVAVVEGIAWITGVVLEGLFG